MVFADKGLVERLEQEGPLSPAEQEIMRTHPRIGYDILKGSPSKYLSMGSIIALKAFAATIIGGFGDVAGNLRLEFIKRSKFFFIAQPATESDFQFLSVKIGGEIQQMNFHADVRRGVRHSGAVADVENSAVCLSAAGGLGSIDTVRRKNHPSGVEVGGGELQTPLEPSFESGERVGGVALLVELARGA